MPFTVNARYGQGQSASHWECRVDVAGPTLLEILQNQNVPIRSSCQGKGSCHQCRVQLLEGVAATSQTDRAAFSAEELSQGWRLSCGLRPRTGLLCQFPLRYHNFEVWKQERAPQSEWWVAADLGTTGLELACVDTHGVWGTLKTLNKQVSQGADVMTRLEVAQRLGVGPLQQRLLQQLESLLQRASSEATKSTPEYSRPTHLLTAGNSAITSFLAHLDIETLAVAPFQPQTLESQTGTVGTVPFETLPLLFSFVGGDLFAGLFLLWKEGNVAQEPWLFVDVGTNSEILFWDGSQLFVASTPAGPAFEGSNISIGMRAESGAIIHPRYQSQEQHWAFDVVNGDRPLGLCGTGLIESLAEAVRYGLISPDGEVWKPQQLFFTRELSLSQADVREFQLAKSAIQTGIEIVSSRGKRPPEKLYLAGAFGSHLPLEECQTLGLLPALPVQTLGNASLTGTILWGQATSEERAAFRHWLETVITPLELALAQDFQDAFVRNMSLESSPVSALS